MAVLQKLRDKGTMLLIVVGSALVLFIVGEAITSSASFRNEAKSNVGIINGKKIKLRSYLEKVDQMTNVYKIENGDNNVNEQATEQIRQSVWENEIQNKLLDNEANAIGMTVTDKEMYNLLVGNNISPIIANRRIFVNPQTGQFDPSIVQNFIQAINAPDASQRIPADQLSQYKSYWQFWENNVKQYQLQRKYASLLSSLIVTNSLDAKNAYNGGKDTVSVVYAMKNYFAIPDSAVKISESDLKELYNKKKEQFKQDANCEIAYVDFPMNPSKADFQDVEAWINKLKPEFSTTDDVAGVVNDNSDISYHGYSLTKSEVDPDFADFAFSGKVNDVDGPIFKDGTYKMARIVETGILSPDSVKLRNIFVAASTPDSTKALADSLENVLKAGGNFATLAAQYSQAQNGRMGGQIGWVHEAGMTKDFANLAFSTPANGYFQQVLPHGINLVEVEEVSNNVPKVKLAVLSRKVTASEHTRADIYNKAKQFASAYNTLEKLQDSTAKEGLVLETAKQVQTSTQQLNNLPKTREVIRWAFNNKTGKVSDVIDCGDNLVVAGIVKNEKEGYAPFKDVKSILQHELLNDKKAEILMAQMKGKSIEQLKTENYAIDSVSNITFNTSFAGSLGYEPELLGTAPLMSANQVSKPMKGVNGAFLFKVLSKDVSQKPFNAREEEVLLNARQQYMINYTAIQALVEMAKIEDLRYKYF